MVTQLFSWMELENHQDNNQRESKGGNVEQAAK